MVGREAPLHELEALLQWAVGGRGRSAYVTGNAGIGKSTLVEAVSARAAEIGMQVSRGWCSAAEMPTFWPWRRLLRDLGGSQPDFASPVPGHIDELDRDRLFASVIEALETKARERPALLVIEDLHWADTASVLLLRSVIDALPAMPAALIVTCRDEPGEAPAEVLTYLRELPPGVLRMELIGLVASAVA
jgi:predicted ATPase